MCFWVAEKTLLMLQSIKRAYRLEYENCKLHSCLVRFADYITRVRETMPSAVRDVVDKEVRPMFDGRGPKELNDNFLQKNSKCLEAIFQGAKMLYYLDHSAQASSLSLVMSFSEDLNDVSIEVSVLNGRNPRLHVSSVALFGLDLHEDTTKPARGRLRCLRSSHGGVH